MFASAIFGLLLAGLAGLAPAPAQELPGDPQAGRSLAVTVCAACHEVEKGARGGMLPDPPGFQRLADDSAMTALALRVFLRTPHRDMPNLILTDAESDDVIAYILGLRRGR
jgi:mono/diheme cytochrome c family protein